MTTVKLLCLIIALLAVVQRHLAFAMMNKNNQINSHNQQVNQNDNSDEEEDEEEEDASKAGQYDKLAPLHSDSTGFVNSGTLTPQQMQQQQQHQQMMLNQYGSGNSGMMTPQQQMMLNQPGSGNFNMMTPQQQMLLNQQMMLNQHGSGNYGMMTPQQQMLLNQQMMLNQHGSGNYGMVPPHPHNMGAMGTGMMNVGSTSFSNFQQPNMQMMQQQQMLQQQGQMASGLNQNRSASRKMSKLNSSMPSLLDSGKGERKFPMSSKGGYTKMNYQLEFKFYYVDKEYVPYPISAYQYHILGQMPYVYEAAVKNDLQREWLAVEEFKALNVVFVDNNKFELNYEKLKKIILTDEQEMKLVSTLAKKFNENDIWAKFICELHLIWNSDIDETKLKEKGNKMTGLFGIGNTTLKAKKNVSKYIQQLVSYSVMGRGMLLYVSLFNATFGMGKSDLDDINEIMVTLTTEERQQIKEKYKTYDPELKKKPNKYDENNKNKGKGLCHDLIDREQSIKENVRYALVIGELCNSNRNQKFTPSLKPKDAHSSYLPETIKKDAELLKEFITADYKQQKKMWATKSATDTVAVGNRIKRMLTTDNYERLRCVLVYYQQGGKDLFADLDKAIKATEKQDRTDKKDAFALLTLARSIFIDALYGRPFLLAVLLHGKLERLYSSALGIWAKGQNEPTNDKEKVKELSDAFNDASRLFLLHGPVQLYEISQVYSDAIQKFTKPVIRKSSKKQQVKPSPSDLLEFLILILTVFTDNEKTDEAYVISGYILILKKLNSKKNEEAEEEEEEDEEYEEEDEDKSVLEYMRDYDFNEMIEDKQLGIKQNNVDVYDKDIVIVRNDFQPNSSVLGILDELIDPNQKPILQSDDITLPSFNAAQLQQQLQQTQQMSAANVFQGQGQMGFQGQQMGAANVFQGQGQQMAAANMFQGQGPMGFQGQQMGHQGQTGLQGQMGHQGQMGPQGHMVTSFNSMNIGGGGHQMQ